MYVCDDEWIGTQVALNAFVPNDERRDANDSRDIFFSLGIVSNILKVADTKHYPRFFTLFMVKCKSENSSDNCIDRKINKMRYTYVHV